MNGGEAMSPPVCRAHNRAELVLAMELSESSVIEESSEEEFEPPIASSRRGAKRRCPPSSQSRGASRGSGASRGRRSARHSAVDLGDEDLSRVRNLRSERIDFERQHIQNLNPQQAIDILTMVLDRDPGVLFDVLALSGPPATTPPTSNQPSWCVCSHCRDMPTDLEKKCCQQPPQTCISTVPHMEEFIPQNGVLRLARTLWNEF
ncbi:uncharacterized protein [Nothobranchius furzeri]|nr:uncharacterized protein LOC129166750 [Nothobranchius furzeri]